MKYKVSVIKLVTLVLMIGALAVAMVACSGAAGTPGPAGPQGEQGLPGETPDPTPPPTTDPTEPVAPPGAAPERTDKMFDHVYLTLKGGRMTSAFEMSEYFKDVDSLLKYIPTSSDATVATAVEKNGTLTITAEKDGTATITVTASDDEGLNTAMGEISVTVVKANTAPTTTGLNVSDVTELQKKLYIVEGLRSDIITVRSDPGAVTAGAAGSVTDSIVDKFKVVIDKEGAADDLVVVGVKKGTEAHKYVISVTPKPEALNADSQTVKIYPMDMFGEMVSKPWTFKANFNKSPSALKDSFGTVELHRGGQNPAGAQKTVAAVTNISGAAISATNPVVFATVIKISEYFRDAHFDASPSDGKRDSSCTVSDGSGDLAVVQELSVLGAAKTGIAADGTDVASSAGPPVVPGTYRVSTDAAIVDEVVTGILNGPEAFDKHLRGSGQLGGILIDSRYKAYGTDMIDGEDLAAGSITTPAIASDQDVRIQGDDLLDSFTVKITCMDKDGSDEVTGKVVVRGSTVTPS